MKIEVNMLLEEACLCHWLLCAFLIYLLPLGLNVNAFLDKWAIKRCSITVFTILKCSHVYFSVKVNCKYS